ncbi:MAG: hypothetical protein DRP74_01745 [Candidatus Omnitrophota bacterium]|nr:MAG: hypothetical protein DRP74_01745 [Candidatus Omnitrophota bacterium]
MKKTRNIFLVTISFSIIAFNIAFAAEKIGYIDVTRTFNEYNKTKSFDKELTNEQEKYEKEREKKVNEVKKLQDKINLLSEKEKEAQQPALEEKIRLLQDFDRQQQTELRKERDERMKEILKDIDDAVEGYAEKEGYSLIFNDQVLVAQDEDLDITDQIISILNKNSKE